MQLKIQIISYDALIDYLFFLPCEQKNSCYTFLLIAKKDSSIDHQIFVQKT